MSSIPLVVNTSLASALRPFRVRSLLCQILCQEKSNIKDTIGDHTNMEPENKDLPNEKQSG